MKATTKNNNRKGKTAHKKRFFIRRADCKKQQNPKGIKDNRKTSLAEAA